MREDTRICRVCGERKPIEEFRERNETRGDKEYARWMRACRECERLVPEVPQRHMKIQCIYDPTDTYTNAWFTCGSFRMTLEAGYWPPGSVWMYGRGGNKVMVKGNELWHLLYDKNDNLEPVAQKAVRYEGDKVPEVQRRLENEGISLY